jgi:serine/threonine protein phosphatase 1
VRHLAIGDIHGAFRSLTRLAEFVPFRPEDTLITLGDYVDKGPQSFEVVDWLIDWSRRGRLIALRGNHELMMLRAREDRRALEDWIAAGGDTTLASYSPLGDRGRLVDVPDAHWEFLDGQTVAWHEIETHFFVHAGAYAELPLAEQPEFILYWEKFHNPPKHESGKIMVCGHTPQKSGLPRNLGHAVCIDTNAWNHGWLTCLDVATHRIWQANEAQETRMGWLEDPT